VNGCNPQVAFYYSFHIGDHMGKGDMRSKRGKIHRGTYGNTRLRKKGKAKKVKRQRAAGGASSGAGSSPA